MVRQRSYRSNIFLIFSLDTPWIFRLDIKIRRIFDTISLQQNHITNLSPYLLSLFEIQAKYLDDVAYNNRFWNNYLHIHKQMKKPL